MNELLVCGPHQNDLNKNRVEIRVSQTYLFCLLCNLESAQEAD
jgi:hypothetical protein